MPSDESLTAVFDRWLGKASENIAEWGYQDETTLLLAMQEELGELTQAHLEARAEGGDPARVDVELDDLGALLLQFHEVRRNTPTMAPPESTTTESELKDGAEYSREVRVDNERGSGGGVRCTPPDDIVSVAEAWAALDDPEWSRVSESMRVETDDDDVPDFLAALMRTGGVCPGCEEAIGVHAGLDEEGCCTNCGEEVIDDA